MSGTTEAFARVKIDALLQDAGWNLTDGSSVLFEHALPDGTQADYVLCDRQSRPMAALEAKRASTDPITAQDQGRHYAEQLGVPFVFLSNGEEVRFLDRETDAQAREIAGFYAQDDLERRIAARRVRRSLATVAINRKIVDRDYQIECIQALSAEVSRGRRKLLVEMATGTGKTRTAAAFIKRLFEAGIVTRVLFLVDRIALARQAEDAFTDHLRDYPCHVLRPGRGFDRAKRITIATLQTMIAEYRTLSPGYFDLVITDECHRSIYGKWGGVLRHFDSIQLGLTATPAGTCVYRLQVQLCSSALDVRACAGVPADLHRPTEPILDRAPVVICKKLFALWILNRDERPRLRVHPARRVNSRVDHLAQHRQWHGIGLEPPHRPHVPHQLKELHHLPPVYGPSYRSRGGRQRCRPGWYHAACFQT